MRSAKKSLDTEVISRLKIFLSAQDFQGAKALLEAAQFDITSRDHKILKELGTLPKDLPSKKTLEWVMEMGNYTTRCPEIALCIYAGTNNLPEVQNLIDKGIDPTLPVSLEKNPSKSSVKYALLEDNEECLKILLQHKSCKTRKFQEETIKTAAYLGSENCFLRLLGLFKKDDPLLYDLWSIWDGGHLIFPSKVAKALVQKLDTPHIQKEIKMETIDRETKKILSKELSSRILKGEQKNSLGLELI